LREVDAGVVVGPAVAQVEACAPQVLDPRPSDAVAGPSASCGMILTQALIDEFVAAGRNAAGDSCERLLDGPVRVGSRGPLDFPAKSAGTLPLFFPHNCSGTRVT
jgi:hypothetical protein